MASALSLRNTLQSKRRFLTDMFAPNMLYGLTIRSEHAHARLIAINTPELPRDITLIRARDIPGINRVEVLGEGAPILAEREVHYYGEPIAILIGPTPGRLLEFAARIEVEYEELGALLELNGSGNEPVARAVKHRVVDERVTQRGDVEQALREADQLVEGTYQTGVQDHLYSEPAGAYAAADASGNVTVFSASQWPYHVRRTVAAVLDIPAEMCRMRSTETGVHLDGKLWFPSVVAAHAALGSRFTGKPVKLVYTREEDFRYSPKGSGVIVHCVTGIDRDGALVAADLTATVNVGAYPLFSDEICSRIAASLVAHYHCEATRVRIRLVTTNVPPLNACAGLGTAHAVFAAETHSARVAEIAQSPPLEWKRRNILRRGMTPAVGGTLTADFDQHDLLSRAAKAADFERKFAAYELQKKRRASFNALFDPPRGIGIAIGHQASGFCGRSEELLESTVWVRLEKDGGAELSCGAVTEGDSIRSVWRHDLASILNIDDSAIRFREPDTAHTPDSGPSTLSRNVTIIGRTIETACNAVKKRRFRAPLPIEIRRNHRPSRALSWDPGSLTGSPYGPLSIAVAVVEVEVSPVTFQPVVRGVWMAINAGRILVRDQAKRVLECGVHNALAWAGVEELQFTGGGLHRDDYHRYQHQRITPLVPITIDFFGDGEKTQPRGLGDLPWVVIPSAFAAAVTQATGRYIDRIPCTADTLRLYTEGDMDEDEVEATVEDEDNVEAESSYGTIQHGTADTSAAETDTHAAPVADAAAAPQSTREDET